MDAYNFDQEIYEKKYSSSSTPPMFTNVYVYFFLLL